VGEFRRLARALSSIEETSRGALREMRALLGVLRNEAITNVIKHAATDRCRGRGRLR
jgi:signal transduction histidine kinase